MNLIQYFLIPESVSWIIMDISLYVQRRIRVDVGHVFDVKINPYVKMKYTFEINLLFESITFLVFLKTYILKIRIPLHVISTRIRHWKRMMNLRNRHIIGILKEILAKDTEE